MEAGVAFHELRRWRVRERDIFRLGSGTIVSLQFFSLVNKPCERVSIPQRSRLYQIGALLSIVGPIICFSIQASSLPGPSNGDPRSHGNVLREEMTISPHTRYTVLRNLSHRVG